MKFLLIVNFTQVSTSTQTSTILRIFMEYKGDEVSLLLALGTL
jgi:hypothetical protein